jgi:hypothetical protein
VTVNDAVAAIPPSVARIMVAPIVFAVAVGLGSDDRRERSRRESGTAGLTE